MDLFKRFISLFIAMTISLSISAAWSMSAYAAKVYTQNYSNASVSTNQTVTSDFIRNYTNGLQISNWSSQITFKNNGVVNVNGGSYGFMLYLAAFENNGTFNFTGSNSTFSFSSSSSFVNNGTATIKGVYNFGIPNETSFVNNGTLYLEDISNPNLSGFINNGIVIISDDAKNSYLHQALEDKNGENGQVYTQSDFENRKLRYMITYEGLNAGNYWDYDNPNPVDYEWAAADPQDVILAEPALDGYEFLGWTGLDVTEPTKNFTFSSSICKEVTVTAHWKPIVYTITYELDGGSFYDGQTPNTEYSRGGQPGLLIPHKTGYTFAGWIDTDTNEQVSTGNAIYYLPPSTLGDKTYKASFIANTDTQYKVICYYQNINGTYEEEKYLFGGETEMSVSVSSGDYDKEGFTYDDDNPGNVLSGTIKSDNSLELKLYFDRNKYTVIFKNQDGSETLLTTERYFGEKVGEYNGVIPSKKSDDDLYTYVFDNWSREEPDRDFGYDVNNVVVSENITFYAAFKEIRNEKIAVITWKEYDGLKKPEQTEIRLASGSDYIVELELENENYYIGTKEWSLGFREEHIYQYDKEIGEQRIEYTVDKDDFNAPIILTIPNVQHDIFIELKAHYHEEHDYANEYDEIIVNGGCINDSVIRHFCYKCGKTYDETITPEGHYLSDIYKSDNVSHWKICTICGAKAETAAHTPDKGIITHEPTHYSTGTKTYSCTICGYVTKREVLEMIPIGSEKTASPVISPDGGRFMGSKTVTITAETGAEIYYTTDGSAPTSASTKYTGGFTLTGSATVKAIAIKDGKVSDTVSVTFTKVSSGGSVRPSRPSSTTAEKPDETPTASPTVNGTKYSWTAADPATGGEKQIKFPLDAGSDNPAVNLGAAESGKLASLMKLDGNGKPVFVSSAKVGADGSVSLRANGAGDYLIVVGSETVLMGDADNDGVLTSRDAAFILKKVADGVVITNPKLDMNSDELVNALDAAMILKLITQ